METKKKKRHWESLEKHVRGENTPERERKVKYGFIVTENNDGRVTSDGGQDRQAD